MARAALADLESLLRARRLDRTLTTALPPPAPGDDRSTAPTGIPVLDERLHGGLPRGQVSECVGPRSSGRTSLWLAAAAAAARRGEIVALVDPLDALDVESAVSAGLDVTRLLWIRGQGLSNGRLSLPQEWGVFHTALDRAVKALTLVLQTGHFGLVGLDLVDMPAPVVRRLPFTTWLRVQRLIEGTDTVCLLLGSAPIARSAGGLTVTLSSERAPGLAGPNERTLRLFPARPIEPSLSGGRWPCLPASLSSRRS